ncbi:MAG: helix-turn-helix domain-containing protein [Anaerolineae bacterium]|nr:helix-turn-helix domain-containing protein [Anaerolineae bacterium]
MDLTCEERLSDSPFIDRVWRSRSDQAGAFISMAESHCGIAVTRYQGKITLTVRGPETRATPAYCPEGAEFFGILFKHGAFIRLFPAQKVMDRRDVNLPGATGKSFWLHGSTWQFPSFDNAETFVDWLVRDDLLVYESVVETVLQDQPVAMSVRSVQRRFAQATGMTQSTLHQIQRARRALALLKQGVPILDVVHEAGYADQPHLTRSLKHLIGQTPAQIISEQRTTRLSLLFKTPVLV